MTTPWESPLDIRIDEDIDPSKENYIIETLDSPELLIEDQVQLDYLCVITPRYIEELDDKGRLRNNEYLHYEVTDEECDGIGEMCDPYESLQVYSIS